MLILSASVLLKITIVINASFFSTNVKSIRGVVLAKVTPPVTSNPVVPGVGGSVGAKSAPNSCSLATTESWVDFPSVQPRIVRVIVVYF